VAGRFSHGDRGESMSCPLFFTREVKVAITCGQSNRQWPAARKLTGITSSAGQWQLRKIRTMSQGRMENLLTFCFPLNDNLPAFYATVIVP
jgi:hypothetical protein